MGADEEVIVEILARTDRLERDLRSARREFDTETDRMRRASDEMRRRMEANNGAIGDTFKKLSGALGAYFSGQQVVALTESYTRFQNSLRVAGVASADLGEVQDRLFASAQKYGVEIGTLGSLYGSLTNASKELGVSQEQIFQLTDTVSASLKVSGQSAQEASGALLQLSQALRGGKIQAEEYNSLLDGAFPLLEAAAAGSDRFGGSVGKLTALVKDGKVSSREFFDAILAGSEGVMKRAEMSTLSLSGAMTQLMQLPILPGWQKRLEAARTPELSSPLPLNVVHPSEPKTGGDPCTTFTPPLNEVHPTPELSSPKPSLTLIEPNIAAPAPKKVKRKPTAKVLMPEDWKPDALPDDLAKLVAQWPADRLQRELREFREYWIERGERRPGWDRTWRQWIGRQHDRVLRESRSGWQRNHAPAAAADLGTDGFIARLERAEAQRRAAAQ